MRGKGIISHLLAIEVRAAGERGRPVFFQLDQFDPFDERLASMAGRVGVAIKVTVSRLPKPVKAKLTMSALLTVGALDSGRGRQGGQR